MYRVSRLGQVARALLSAKHSQAPQQATTAVSCQALELLAGNATSITQSRGFAAAAAPGDSIATDYDQSTGLERAELEGKSKGVDIFHEDWLDAPWGTEDKPVQVTSAFAERIVGVPDPYDDSVIWWGNIKEGEPPKQIVEGGEFFVLKRLTDEGASHGH